MVRPCRSSIGRSVTPFALPDTIFFHLSRNELDPPFEPDGLTLDGHKLPPGRHFDDTRNPARMALARDLKIRFCMNIRT